MQDVNESKKSSKLDIWLDEERENLLCDITSLVKIESVAQEEDPTSDEPFGSECKKALDQFLYISRRDKMESYNHDGYCASAIIGSSNKTKPEIGIWNHLDVVPVGSGWTYPPLKCTIKDGYVIGRGVQDNKGPAMAVHYAMKYCLQQDLIKNIRVRQILGCQEESGMRDVKHYLENEKAPNYSFVADCGFPVCCGEKGHYNVTFKSRNYFSRFKELSAGTAANMIPDEATAVLVTEQGEKTYQCRGIGGHAAFPPGSKNAIGMLAAKLKKVIGRDKNYLDLLEFLYRTASDGYGRKLGIACEDELSGKLTCNAGILKLERGKTILSLDIRYPITVSGASIKKQLYSEADKSGFDIIKEEDDPPYYMNEKSSFVQTLMSGWKEETGQNDEPFVMGGGTYARKIPNAIGFGPGQDRDFSVLGLSEGHGNCHSADEAESVDNIQKAVKIYVNALVKLDQWVGKGMVNNENI